MEPQIDQEGVEYAYDVMELRAKKAEAALEALIGASTGRLHDCDDACTWAHSEYAKLLMKGQREAERERLEKSRAALLEALLAQGVRLDGSRWHTFVCNGIDGPTCTSDCILARDAIEQATN